MLSIVPDYSDSSSDFSDTDDKDHLQDGTRASTSPCKDTSQRDDDGLKSSTNEIAQLSGITKTQWQRFLTLQSRKDDGLLELSSAKDCLSRKRKRRRGGNKRQHMNASETFQKESPSGSGTATSEGDLEWKEKKEGSSTNEQRWESLKSYLDVNDHLKGAQIDHGNLGPKSGLQKQIDAAVAKRDFDKAEELSDQLSSRDFACRVAKAADVRDYVAMKKEEEEKKSLRKKQKKSKLRWGFEVKHRWEMKGNM